MAAGLTWVFDSRFGTVEIDGKKHESRRVMVNSAGGARLYTKATTSPIRKLRDSNFGADGEGRWIVEGTNEETGEHEVWSIAVVKNPARCGSCGG